MPVTGRQSTIDNPDPVRRVTPPSTTIKNTSAQPDRLIGVDCACAERSEVHEMRMNDGIMRMRALADGLPIPAGGSVELKPGGFHLMFIRLRAPLVAGEAVRATLMFERAGTIETTFEVRTLRGKRMGHKH